MRCYCTAFPVNNGFEIFKFDLAPYVTSSQHFGTVRIDRDAEINPKKGNKKISLLTRQTKEANNKWANTTQ
jgi:hypothetical protein